MLSERSQSQKVQLHLAFSKRQDHSSGDQMSGCQGLGVGGDGDDTGIAHGTFWGQWKRSES